MKGTSGRLFEPISKHLDKLSESIRSHESNATETSEQLAAWILGRLQSGGTAPIVVICTGNSRRSMLASVMGNLAAAYLELPEIRFHSGGTAPSAFNERTVAALEAIGVEIASTGEEAPRGEPNVANPIYQVRWGRAGEPPMEMIEFSKRYDDSVNPKTGFAALLVCNEADDACPAVFGAALRIAMPFEDPKWRDGQSDEAATYAARRDEIGRVLLSVLRSVKEHRDNGA